MIFHITERARWKRSLAERVHTGSTRGVELAEQGFIHCSTAAQWPGVLEAFYADADDLLLLHIDENRLRAPLVVEQLDGALEPFPHIYGPLNLDAVVEAEPLRPGRTGPPGPRRA
jgi:glutathione S-transferase